MVLARSAHENSYVKCVPGDPIIGELMRAGGTLYRKYDQGLILIAPKNYSHSAAWALMKESQ